MQKFCFFSWWLTRRIERKIIKRNKLLRASLMTHRSWLSFLPTQLTVLREIVHRWQATLVLAVVGVVGSRRRRQESRGHRDVVTHGGRLLRVHRWTGSNRIEPGAVQTKRHWETWKFIFSFALFNSWVYFFLKFFYYFLFLYDFDWNYDDFVEMSNKKVEI